MVGWEEVGVVGGGDRLVGWLVGWFGLSLNCERDGQSVAWSVRCGDRVVGWCGGWVVWWVAGSYVGWVVGVVGGWCGGWAVVMLGGW